MASPSDLTEKTQNRATQPQLRAQGAALGKGHPLK